MTSDGRVVIDTRLDPSGVVNGLESMRTSLKGTVTKIAGLIGVAFGTAKLIKFGKEAISLASDLQETQNVVDTAFGDMSYKMEQFADTAIETYGISKLVAKQTGSTYMSMAKGMGIASDMASDMSISLTGLSADMASFYNVSQDVASVALNSIFTGETETLKKFGIVMTEVNLQNFAYSNGINKKIREMTQAEKTQLRYNYVMQQTKLAQGDFAKTSDSWANQTRILSERWKEFLTIMGNGLVKVLTPVLNMLNKLLSKLIDIGNALADTFGFKFEATATEAIDSTIDSTNELTESTVELKKAQDKLLGGYDKLNVISKSKNDEGSGDIGLGGVSTGTADLTSKQTSATNSTNKFTEALETLRKKFEELQEFMSPVFQSLQKNVLPVIQQFKESAVSIFRLLKSDLEMILGDIVDIVILPTFSTLNSDVLPVISGFLIELIKTYETYFTELNSLFNNIYSTGIKPTLELIMNIWQKAWKTIKEFWDEYGADVFETLREDISAVFDVLGVLWDYFIGPTFNTVLKSINSLADALLPMLKEVASLLAEQFLLFSEIFKKAIVPIYSYLVKKLGPVISEIIGFFTKIATVVLTDVIKSFTDLLSVFKNLTSFFKNVLRGDWKKAWDNIVGIFRSAWNLIKRIFSFETVSKFFTILIGKIKKPFLAIASWFGTQFSKVWKAIKSVFDFKKVAEFFGKVLSKISKPFVSIASWFGKQFSKVWTTITSMLSIKKVSKFFWNIWDKIKKPFLTIASWFGNKFSSVWKKITSMLSIKKVAKFFGNVWTKIKNPFVNVASWFGKKFSSAWKNIKNKFDISNVSKFFWDVWDKITAPFVDIFGYFKEVFRKAWDNIKSIFSWDNVSHWFSKVWGWVSSPFTSIYSWFSNKFSDAWKGIKEIFSYENVLTFFDTVWQTMKKPFSFVAGWFQSTFEGAWTKVKNVFSKGGQIFKDIGEGIFETFKEIVNHLIDGINDVVSIPFQAINGALKGLRGISIVGEHPFSFLPTISIPEIPKLATGAVLPANKPFMAMVGDQKFGKNVEAPADLIKQMVIEGLKEVNNKDVNVNVVLEGDAKGVFRLVKKEQIKYNKMKGVRV